MVNRHEVVPTAGAMTRLAGQVDRLERDLDAVSGLAADVAHLGQALSEVTALVRRLTPTPTDPDPGRGPDPAAAPAAALDDGGDDAAEEQGGPWPVVEWMSVSDPGLAVAWLTDAQVWVAHVWRHYGPVVGCWMWHPPVVAELLACMTSWDAAQDPDAGPDALSAWHDRWRPGAASRITRATATCEKAGHHVAGLDHYDVDDSCGDLVAEWWATTHGTGTAPGLTPTTRH